MSDLKSGFSTSEHFWHGAGFLSCLGGIVAIVWNMMVSGVITPDMIQHFTASASDQVKQLAEFLKATNDPVSIICMAIEKLGGLAILAAGAYKFLSKYTDSRTSLKTAHMEYLSKKPPVDDIVNAVVEQLAKVKPKDPSA